MRTIAINMSSLRNTVYDSSTIRQGENLATELQITLSSEFSGYSHYLVLQNNSNTPVVTPILVPDLRNVLHYPLSLALTSEAGWLKVEIHAIDDAGALMKSASYTQEILSADNYDSIIMKSAIYTMAISPTLNGTDVEAMPVEYVPWFTQSVAAVESARALFGQFSEAEEARVVADNLREGRIASLETDKTDKVDSLYALDDALISDPIPKDADTLQGYNAAHFASQANTYTKTEVDGKDALKADKADTYTKTETDAAITLKADKANTYTKTEVDGKDALLVPKTTTVNTKALSGNISISAIDVPNTPAGGISATSVQAAINELDAEKAAKTEIIYTGDDLPVAPLPRDADTLQGHAATYFASAATTYTKTEVDNVTNPLTTRVTAIEANFKQYGVRRVLNATSPLLERLYDSVGKIAQVPMDDGIATNDFDNIYPWSHIRECKIASGRVTYKTDPGYDALTVCDWMVEIPKFYLQITQDTTTRDIVISQYKHPGFWTPQAFRAENGAELDKIYVGRFKTGIDGTSDVSRPGYFPENLRDLASFRTGARAKGAGWQQIDLSYVQEVLHPLYLVESATLNSQDYLGAGLTSFRYATTDTAQLAETAVNRIVVTNVAAANYNVGENICIGTSQGSENIAKDLTILSKTALVDGVNTEIVFDGTPVNIALGNVLWQGAQKGGQTVSLTKPNGKLSGVSGRRSNKYRGLEDTFGNVYEWVDGVLISDLVSQVCRKPSLYASALTADYKPAGYANIDVNGYPKEMGWDENFPEARFPISVGAGTTTGYCDNYYQAIGLRGAYFGGSAAVGAFAGLFYWFLGDTPAAASWNFGSRLLFKPPV